MNEAEKKEYFLSACGRTKGRRCVTNVALFRFKCCIFGLERRSQMALSRGSVRKKGLFFSATAQCTETTAICCDNNDTKDERQSATSVRTRPAFQSKRNRTRGYREVTRIVRINNPPTAYERLIFLTFVLRNSPPDTSITPPGSRVAQCPQVLLRRH